MVNMVRIFPVPNIHQPNQTPRHEIRSLFTTKVSKMQSLTVFPALKISANHLHKTSFQTTTTHLSSLNSANPAQRAFFATSLCLEKYVMQLLAGLLYA